MDYAKAKTRKGRDSGEMWKLKEVDSIAIEQTKRFAIYLKNLTIVLYSLLAKGLNKLWWGRGAWGGI